MRDLAFRPQDLGIGQLFERVRDAVIVADAHTGRIALWNPAAERIFGYSRAEALGMSVERLVPGYLKARHRAGMAGYRDTGHGRYIDSNKVLDLPAVRKTGEEIRVELTLSPIEPVDGAAVEGRFVLAIVRETTERKQAEEKLRESEEHYRLVARATNEAIWDSDLLADKQTWDGAFETMFGYPLREETNGAWWEERIHPEDRERVLSGIDDVLQGMGETWSDEYRFRRADGTYATVVDRGYVVRDAEGEPVRVIGSMMDVTERRRAEEALRTSEAELRALIAAMTDVILVLDIEGRYLKVAPTNPSLLYKPSDELVGKTLHEVMPGKQADVFLEHIRRALETQRPVDTEYSLQIAGEEVWFAGTVSPMQEDSVVYVARDITVRKRAEEEIRRLNEELEERVKERTARLEAALAELRSSEERYRLLVESAEDYAIFMVDREGRVADWNVGAERTFGYGEEEIVGKPFSILFTPEDIRSGAPEEELRKAAAEGRAEDERWHIRKDGTQFWASGVVTPARDEAGNVRGFAKVARDETERKEAEKRLREAETRYRTLVEQIPAITYVQEPVESSRPKAVTYMSPQYETILGYPSESEAIDEEHWLRMLHPEDREWVLAEEVRTDETGEPFEVEYRVIAAHGRIVWLRDQATLVRDEEGTPRYWLGVQYDITERKESEAALQESERRFRALVQNSSDVITVVDAEGIIRYVSPAVERVMGYRPEELVGKSVFDHAHPEDLEQGRSAFAGIWSQPGIHPPFEFRVPHKDGSWRQSEFILNNLLDDPSVRGVVLNQRDITERKEAEEALSQSEERYRAVVEQSAEGLYLVDGVTKRILETNPALQNMLGYEAEELRGMELHEIVAHAREDVEANVERTLREGGTRFFREQMYRRKDGSVVEVQIAASAISYGGKRVICAAIRDVTERREAEEQLRESEEIHRKVDARLYEELTERERELHYLVGRIMATQEEERRRVAYEVHDGFTQMAAAAYRRLALFAEHHPPESARDREELEEAIALVRRTVGEARRVIANLRPTTLDDFGLATAIRMQVEELRTEGYETTYEETLGEARLPATLETALFRLAQEALTNVRKHAQTDRVRVALELRDRTVRLEVSDQGRGFAPAEAKQGAGPGERVGLSSMRERIALLGGRFEIRSEPGTGTSVVAEVPLKATGEEVDGGE